jgi:hypothetical protein
LRQSTLAKWVLRTLTLQGPQAFASLLSLLRSDPEYGYIPLEDKYFEARLRQCLAIYSREPENYFSLSLNYDWEAIRPPFNEELDIPLKMNGQAWISIGEGRESVYGIFSPKTIRESHQMKIGSYPIKIGRTERPISERLVELQTGNFMDLQIGLVMKTNQSRELEKYLHSQLSHRKLVGKSSQSEWFLSSLEAILILHQQHPIDA